MGLSDDLQGLQTKHHVRNSCLVRTILGTLDDADRSALIQALENPTISSASISRTLIANGVIAKQGVINKHRKGDCSCNVLD